MKPFSIFGPARAGAVLGLALSAAMLQAQGVIPPPSTPNADRLAAQMKILAGDPNNIEALVSAGEANIRLDDPEAALQFFQRAERVGGTSPRITAGRASALVALERPGEALLLFRQAEAAGYPVAGMAMDRGLAYDLLGYPRYAQRDYRAVLARGDDPEVVRRLALSLGISGDVKESEAVLLPLLQANDRSAWRVRAFVLAMNGDVAQANQIANGMLPGFGPTLAPYFARLEKMSAADRAFAVNFGRLDSTPQRLADARLIAPLPPLADDGPVRLASADDMRGRKAADRGRDRDRRSRRGGDAPPAARAAAPSPTPPPPAAPPPVAVAAAPPVSVPPAVAPPVGRAGSSASAGGPLGSPVASAPVRVAAAPPAPRPQPFVLRAGQAAPAVWAPIPQTLRPVELPPSSVPSADFAQGAPMPAPAPGFAKADGAPIVAPPPASAPPVVAAAPPPAPNAQDDADARQRNLDALGAVVARLTDGDAAGASDRPTPSPGASDAPPPAKSGDDAVVFRAKPFVPTPPAPKPDAAPPPEPKVVVAPPKPAPKPAPPPKPKPDPAKLEPPRIWVQVAGGADEKALPFTWRRLAKQAPDAFKGRDAWATPVAATNRLLAGPFATAKEAQAFVNQLAGAGIQAFAWTSAAGQKIDKLKLK